MLTLLARGYQMRLQKNRAALFRDPSGYSLQVANIGGPTIGFTFYNDEEPLMGMISSECI
jgi:hypothetical protein